MPQVSKYPMPKDVYERVTDLFLKTVSNLKTKSQVNDFFEQLLTPTEQVMLAKRLSIAFLLAKKYDYRSISKLLRVSTTTIANIAGYYKYNDEFRKYIDKVIKEEQFEEFLISLSERLTSALSAGKSKSGSWVYLRDEIRKKKRSKAF